MKMRINGLTDKGRNALRSEELQGVQLLILEIANRAPNVSQKHLAELTSQMVAHYGSPEAAIEALRTGRAKVQKAT